MFAAVFAAVTGFRNNLVLKLRLRAIDIIYVQPDWETLKKLLENPSYYEMVFDVTRWTFKQYYPILVERENSSTKS